MLECRDLGCLQDGSNKGMKAPGGSAFMYDGKGSELNGCRCVPVVQT